MSYILRRIDHRGGYVADSAYHQSSYVHDALQARRFATAEEADQNRCVDNEVIVDLSTGNLVAR